MRVSPGWRMSSDRIWWVGWNKASTRSPTLKRWEGKKRPLTLRWRRKCSQSSRLRIPRVRSEWSSGGSMGRCSKMGSGVTISSREAIPRGTLQSAGRMPLSRSSLGSRMSLMERRRLFLSMARRRRGLGLRAECWLEKKEEKLQLKKMWLL